MAAHCSHGMHTGDRLRHTHKHTHTIAAATEQQRTHVRSLQAPSLIASTSTLVKQPLVSSPLTSPTPLSHQSKFISSVNAAFLAFLLFLLFWMALMGAKLVLHFVESASHFLARVMPAFQVL